jgi:hypothetical protein
MSRLGRRFMFIAAILRGWQWPAAPATGELLD